MQHSLTRTGSISKTQPFHFNTRLHRLAVEAVYDVNVFSVACGPALFDAEDDLSVMLEDWEEEPEALLRDIAPDLKKRYRDIRHMDLHLSLTPSKGTPWTLKDWENRAALITLFFDKAQELFPNVKTVSLWLDADPLFEVALHRGIPDTMNDAANMAADDPRVMQPALLCLLYSILDDALKTFSIHSVAFSRWDTAKGWMMNLKHLTDIADLVKVMSQPGNEALQFRVKTCTFT